MRGFIVFEFEEEIGFGVYEVVVFVGGFDLLLGLIGGDICGFIMFEFVGDISLVGSKVGMDERGIVVLLGDSGFKEVG